MSEVSAMLKEFHTLYQVAGDRTAPGIPDDAVCALRFDLLQEEFLEYQEAYFADDVVEIADALADMVYIIYGTARAYGIPLDAVLAEVHRSNLSKLGADGRPIFSDTGKVLKGPNYSPPDVAGVLAPYGLEGK